VLGIGGVVAATCRTWATSNRRVRRIRQNLHALHARSMNGSERAARPANAAFSTTLGAKMTGLHPSFPA